MPCGDHRFKGRGTILFMLVVVIPFVTSFPQVPEASQFARQVRNWFEWGEYDKILADVPSRLDALGESDEKASLHVYVGVAYYTHSRLSRAKEQFYKALEIDAGVELDTDYVSSEIQDFFRLTRNEFKKLAAEKARIDSLRVARERQQKLSRAAVRDSLTLEKQFARARRIKAYSLASLGLAGVAAFVSGYQYVCADESYEKFLVAARDQRDLADYTRYKEKTQFHDRASIVSAAVSITSTITSAILFSKARVIHRKIQERKQARP